MTTAEPISIKDLYVSMAMALPLFIVPRGIHITEEFRQKATFYECKHVEVICAITDVKLKRMFLEKIFEESRGNKNECKV